MTATTQLFKETKKHRSWNFHKKTVNSINRSREEFNNKEVVDWKIYVEGLGWVKSNWKKLDKIIVPTEIDLRIIARKKAIRKIKDLFPLTYLDQGCYKRSIEQLEILEQERDSAK